ncbi:MAG: hypothetical protein HOJ35_02080 [Bdellovibrionales bacterium]|jgi:hypothetical protein|nr:hypothetical protein [Bdellovibrionales bacterium]
MLDKLHLRSNIHIDDSTLNKLFMSGCFTKFKIRVSGFNNSYVINKSGNHLMTIKRDPWLDRCWKTYIELNPNSFKKHNNLLGFLDKLKANLNSYEIRRIDHCADMNIPIGLIRDSLIVKHKVKRTDYEARDNISGMYFGKNNEVIAIYNKKLQLKDKKKIFIKLDCTRFEVRQYKKKINHTSLFSLDKFLNENPFKSLLFSNIDINEHDPKTLNLRDRVFLEQVNQSGLHSAYKVFNTNSNFKRNFGKHLTETNYGEEILSKYHQGLKEYLDE